MTIDARHAMEMLSHLPASAADEAGRKPRSKSRADRFWRGVVRGAPDECWPWKDTLNHRGYGVFGRLGKQWRAHRVSYELHVGPIPEGMAICHRCDNRLCVNPKHLFVGSHADNVKDMVAKGRQRGAPRGLKNGNGKLSLEQVAAIRRSPLHHAVLGSMYGISRGHAYRIKHDDYYATYDEKTAS